MAPYFKGTIYPELQAQIRDSAILNVLILCEATMDTLTLQAKIDVLHNYIEDKIQDGTKIIIHSVKSATKNIYDSIEFLKIGELDISSVVLIEKAITELDIDVVLDLNKFIKKKPKLELDKITKVVNSYKELEEQIETFLMGRNIPWLLNLPMWYTTVQLRYLSRPGLATDALALMARIQNSSSHTDKQVTKVRYFANKMTQIDYAKDLLNSFIMKKRRIARNTIEHQDYSFELNYHLSNYYFLISGVLDLLARFLNELYSLGITSHFFLALEKDKFIEIISEKQKKLSEEIYTKDFSEWIKWMKLRRNFIAHDAGMSHTSLLQEKKVKMTQEELEAKIDAQTDGFKKLLTPELYQSHRDIVANLVSLDDYDEVMADVMVVETSDGQKMFQPLMNIDYDYEQLTELLINLLKAVDNNWPLK